MGGQVIKPETAQALADALGGKLQPDGLFIIIIKHTGKTGEYDVNSIPVSVAGMAHLAIEYEIDVCYYENAQGEKWIEACFYGSENIVITVDHNGTQESKEAAYCEAVARCLIQMLGE